MIINEQIIENILLLSRLDIPDSDKKDFASDISDIIKMVSQINKIDTSNIEPIITYPMNNMQRLRDDKISEILDQRKQCQYIAPQVQSGLYIVPIVVE